MARARGRTAKFHCHSCSREWYGVAMQLDADMRALHDLFAESCTRCSLTHGRSRGCAYAPERCTCSDSHVQVLYNNHSSGGVQVRASQRTAYYRMPDGTISLPETNALDDLGAVMASRAGGVREEAFHLSDLRNLHDERRYSRDELIELGYSDEYGRITVEDYTDRPLTLDWDQQSILDQDYRHASIEREDEHRREIQRAIESGAIQFGGERYEEALRRRNQ